MKTIVLAFGTRPEAVKMCPLVKELRKHPKDFRTVVCVTGQHRQMLDQVLKVFDIAPDYDLSVMKENQTLFDVTIGILARFDRVLEESRPDLVLVHGDTTTTFAAALACFYRHVPVGHVEAGLRTYNLDFPFPEEFNRQAVGLVSRFHFAPTENCRQNLLREGKKPETIFVTGNTAIDALKTTVREDYSHPELTWASDGKLLLITAHRRENLGEPMHHMFRAIRKVVETHPDIRAVYPIHMNPAVRRIAEAEFEGCDRIHLIEPLDVSDFHNFLARAYLVLTDSGGIQEEAPALGKPVLVMRDTTERPEGVSAGTLRLTGTEEHKICRECDRLLTSEEEYQKMAKAVNPYGDGTASRQIAAILKEHLQQGEADVIL
ncbi:UDP-N-acetylglucosamine 2-epimerase [Hornefia porci]|uniref:UDP-N-acetylglucosamine 2-epimerase (non-hydrolyzing) n=1 Tax=Hornefia porci TaxID=2652292 RepID=A0A1Q9JF12_9FIRM|nr:UDP-N-acetylglucosamine 2-epimerase (non-hydrolyzing) [Hornefia porci]OLR54773.1 UDP-N-acetylglucosamine 2-epimerase [Hornefia porci]